MATAAVTAAASAAVLAATLAASSSAPAHVYAADQGLHLENETVEAILYDDATYLVLVLKGSVLFAYDLGPDAPGGHERLVWTYPLQEGPRWVDKMLLVCFTKGCWVW